METRSDSDQLASLLWQAHQLADERRQQFLNEACQHPEQRREIEELLAAAQSVEQASRLVFPFELEAGPFFDSEQPMFAGLVSAYLEKDIDTPDVASPPAAAPAETREDTIDPMLEGNNRQIGHYCLREKIGEGGFGVVYVAEQEKPIRRKVALKLIKPGMDSRQVVARFEAERQALALMDHPNIAKVLDAGTSDDGRPYFVMELVNGVPITKYAEKQQISLNERLTLMKCVCEAVEHAHKKGIIHRDIKPSNVLVTLHDGQPVVKVIDFGVAKALHQRLTEQTLYTAMGQMIGTPMYMSPEQAELSGLDVDTRSDVYSLGVLLYELLTGMTPFDRESFKQAGYDAMVKMIREVEPPRPSLRVSTAAAQRDDSRISDRRRIDERKLSASLRGELDWIAMKALEKQRQRRYQSARELATDLENFLTDQPVSARPPSWAYRSKKYVRRHRVGLGIAATFVLVVATAMASLALIARERASAANRELLELEGSLQRLTSDQEAIELLVRDKQWLKALTLVQTLVEHRDFVLLTEPERRRISAFKTELQLVADLEQAQLESEEWSEAGFDHAAADSRFRTAFRGFGIDFETHSEQQVAAMLKTRVTLVIPVATGLEEWAIIHTQIPADSKDYYLQKRGKRPQGPPTDPVISEYEFAGRLLRLASKIDDAPMRMRIRKIAHEPVSGKRSRKLQQISDEMTVKAVPLTTVRLLANILSRDNQIELASEVLERAVLRHPDDFWSNYLLSKYSYKLEDYEASLRYLFAAYALRPRHSAVLANIAAMFSNLGRFSKSEFYSRYAADVDPDNCFAITFLANNLCHRRQHDEAEAVLRELLARHPEFAPAWASLSVVLALQDRDLEANEAQEKALKLHPDPTYVAQYLIILHHRFRNRLRAEELLKSLFDSGVELYGDDVYRLGRIQQQHKRLDAAEQMFKRALMMDFYDDSAQASTFVRLGMVLMRLGREQEAIDSITDGLEWDASQAHLHDRMARILLEVKTPRLRDPARALEHAKRAIDLFQEDGGPSWFNWQTLGLALVENELFFEALDVVKTMNNANAAKGIAQKTFDFARVERDSNPEHAENILRNLIGAGDRVPKSLLAHVHVNLGMTIRYHTAKNASDLEVAISHFESAIQIDPTCAAAYDQLSRILSSANDEPIRDPRASLAAAQKMVAVTPGFLSQAHPLATLGMAQYRAGRHQDAISTFERAIEAQSDGGPSLAPLSLFIAMSYWKIGDEQNAREWYEKAKTERVGPHFKAISEEADAMIELSPN